jgi:hypothetical protein
MQPFFPSRLIDSLPLYAAMADQVVILAYRPDQRRARLAAISALLLGLAFLGFVAGMRKPSFMKKCLVMCTKFLLPKKESCKLTSPSHTQEHGDKAFLVLQGCCRSIISRRKA